jgi:hypothetical protein
MYTYLPGHRCSFFVELWVNAGSDLMIPEMVNLGLTTLELKAPIWTIQYCVCA